MDTHQAGAPFDRHKPLNILCLDGGGVRGLSSLLILRNIVERLRVRHNLDDAPLPCEIFDLICGTSTGGLIAIMLGRLRMSVQEAIDCYVDFSSRVFGHPKQFAWFRRLAGEAMYDASTLEECIKNVAQTHCGNRDASLSDPRDGTEGCCRTFVVAVTRSHAAAPPKIFRTYRTTSRVADSCAIWEAARATTAATTFFPPMRVSGSPPQTFIDGGLSGANNPSKLAREEIQEIFPGRSIGCFLSLGTGAGKVVSVSGGFIEIAKACAQLVTNCEIVDHDVGKRFRTETGKGGQANPYFRFSVGQGLQAVILDEWERIEYMTDVTEGYLREDDQVSRAEACVNVLTERVGEVKASAEAEVEALLENPSLL